MISRVHICSSRRRGGGGIDVVAQAHQTRTTTHLEHFVPASGPVTSWGHRTCNPGDAAMGVQGRHQVQLAACRGILSTEQELVLLLLLLLLLYEGMYRWYRGGRARENKSTVYYCCRRTCRARMRMRITLVVVSTGMNLVMIGVRRG